MSRNYNTILMKTKLFFLLFFASLSSFAQSNIPANGLLAYYPFTGNANDASGKGNNGVATDVTLTSDRFGVNNSAYSFNGTSSAIETNIANYPLKGGSRTITGWFKADNPIVSQEFDFCLLNYGNISDPNYWFKISFYRKGYLDIQFDSQTFQSQENYFNNQWTFFALTFDDSTNTYSLHINGVFKMGGTTDLYTNGFGNLFRIGKNKLNNYFEGTIDDIGIWDRVLTQQEITGLHNAGSNDPNLFTLIPDINFEKKLIALDIDSGTTDGKVLTSKISSLTSLDVSWKSISDLTGIQDFVALTSLNCSGNQLTTLDVSKNIALTDLECNNVKLTTLDVSTNTSLITLRCYNNQLTTLDLTKNKVLSVLSFYSNQLSEINLSNNVALDTLICNSNKLITLDVSKNVNLKRMSCSNNKLVSLNLKNGNNVNFENSSINYSYNPNLTCIQVDNKTYSDTNWTNSKDATASYSDNCPPPSVVVSSEFEDKLIALGIDKDGKNGSVLLSEAINVTSIDVSNSGITNLSGIEYFTTLEALICKGNSLTTINLSSNQALKYLDCSNNPLTTLDVSKNILLTELYCDGIVNIINKKSTVKSRVANQLTVLDLSNNLFLIKLSCSNNQLVSLDLSKNKLLTDINCSNNSLQNLNLNNGNNTKLISVNFKNNASLSCIRVDDDVYANANWSGAKDATSIYSKTTCTLGLEDPVFKNISVYPNPTKDLLHLDNIVLENVIIYDSLGKSVKSKTFTSGTTQNSINVSSLPKGLYFASISSEGVTTVKKIMVE